MNNVAHLNMSSSIDSHFRLLDLFCGEGLAAWGYWLSGRFSEIVGVDIHEFRGRYSFDFIRGDALTLDYAFLDQFDFIHASPPCQAYSKATPEAARGRHMRLVAATHLMLHAAGKPYVIENVEGSSQELRPNIVLNGQSLGLPIDRRRYFHASVLKSPIRKIMRNQVSHHIHDSIDRQSLIEAMGLEVINPNALKKMTVKGMKQGIPPAMTHYISTRLLAHKVMIGA
jgi:DNA (cytosine-5)-methyltransferase 1